MSGGWVAGSVRATGLAQRRLGAAGARELALSRSLPAAQRLLADGPYGTGIRIGAPLADTEHAVSAAVLWQIRVLAGWLPRAGIGMIRCLAGGFEAANICSLAAEFAGAAPEPVFELGALGVAWPRLRTSRSLPELAAGLRDSTWGDAGGETAADIADGVLLAWAARVNSFVPEAGAWALGAAALLIARRRLLEARAIPPVLAQRAVRLLGPGALAATEPAVFAGALPRSAGWALTGIDAADELWRGEFAWWSRVERDGQKLLSAHVFGAAAVVGAVALLAADGHRVRAALQAAAGFATPEAFDELV